MVDNKNYYLQKVKISESSQCQLCNANPETVAHLFSECRETLELWTNVEYWILTRTGTSIKFDTTMKILGYHKYDSNFWPVNFILITVRYYVFKCSKQKQNLNIFQVQKLIKKQYDEQKLLSELDGRSEIFEKRWHNWKNLFTNI